MPRLFQNLQGTCTPPETLCPGSGHSLACLCQAWPRFSSQPRPHASAQGSRNLDLGWDQGLAVGAAPLPRSFGHTDYNGSLCRRDSHYCYRQQLPPCPSNHPRLWQSNFRTWPVLLPTLWQGREKLGWVGNTFSGGASSPTLCLGHFKVKFSSMNVQPVSKEKFLW